jgi:oxygen-dependent protoporphyrinogen oxidase
MEQHSTSPSARPKRVVVVGAGISGLATAYWLKKQGVDVTVLEKEPSAGGTMKTARENGWLIETGPNSALETTPLFRELTGELGLSGQFLYANSKADKRYILRGGRLRALPMGPKDFLTTDLWTLAGKLRLLMEPFIGRALNEESIAEFVERRLGREFLDYGINPFVAGVYAGNPEQLSVQTAFPKLYALEGKYGSLINGMIRGARERKARKEIAKDRAKLFSFQNGMQTLPDTLAASLGERVRCNATVEHIIPMKAGRFPVYTVSYTEHGVRQSVEADAVVLSSPAHAASEIIRPIDPDMSAILDAIYYPPVAEIYLGFKADQVHRELDGFGFLVPAVEKRNILGCIWSSTLFPGRAPEGDVAFTIFVGGARQPELVALTDEELLSIVLAEVSETMRIAGGPIFQQITRWGKAIPQYNIGYYKVLQAIERFEQNFPGAFICSNYRGGIAVGDCVMNAEKTTKAVSAYIKQ